MFRVSVMTSTGIPFQEARDLVISHTPTLCPVRRPLLECLGLVLARDEIAREDIPSFTNSAMDGYAVIATDLAGASPESPCQLEEIESVMAGDVPALPVRFGTCSRVMTGAPMPPGADAVVRIEDTTREGTRVNIFRAVQAGQDVRFAGEDVKAGEVVLEAGCIIRAYEIALLASIGITETEVYPRPFVGIIATGDEILPINASLQPGKVRNSGAMAIAAQTLATGGIPRDLGIVPDNCAEIEQAISVAVASHDAVITLGGVSIGDEDYVRPVVAKLGEVIFWRAAIRPGNPILFGIIEGKPCFSLPGNPTSAMLTFELFVKPALKKMMGHVNLFKPEKKARAASELPSRKGVTHFLRAIVEEREGELWVRSAGPQGSGIHKTFARANCLAVIPDGDSIREGQEVTIIELNYDCQTCLISNKHCTQ